MNRLWVRLTLAFVAVTLVGVGTIALLTDWNTGRQFRQYLEQQDTLVEGGLLDDLAAFYQRNGDWNGVEQVFSTQVGMGRRGQMQGRGRPAYVLANAQSQVVYDARGAFTTGTTLDAAARASAAPVRLANGQIVGYLAIVAPAGRGMMAQPEQTFLDELRRTLVVAALLAVGMGILMGLVVSRMLAAPLASLAQTARAFGARQWDRRVPVQGTEEIAAVAREFNDMAETIQRAETLRRNLMADVAHELRTPITVLQGNLRAMLDGIYPLQASEIAILYDETRSLSRIVDDLRELALADAGQLQLDVKPVQIGETVRSVIAGFTAPAETQNVHLTVDGDVNARAIADPDRLAQVLRNLIANALRHSREGDTITISISPAPTMVRVSVADTGEGIAPEDLPHVFDRFYRGEKSRARSSGGTGLGLAIAKAWVEVMGGEISVASKPGQGSTFSFTLPCAA